MINITFSFCRIDQIGPKNDKKSFNLSTMTTAVGSTSPTLSMSMSSTSTSTMSTAVATDLLVNFPWDELDLPLDRDVGACFSWDLVGLLDGLLFGDVVAGLSGDLVTLSARHLDSLLLTFLCWLRVTGLYRDLVTALLRFLAALWCTISPAVSRLGSLTLRHVGSGALLLVAGGTHLLVLSGALLLVLSPGRLRALGLILRSTLLLVTCLIFCLVLCGALILIAGGAALPVDRIVGGEVGSLRDVPALGSLTP